MKTTIKSSLLLLLTACIWGVAFAAQSAGMDYVGPFTFNTARFLLGGTVLLPLIFWRGRAERISSFQPEVCAAHKVSGRWKKHGYKVERNAFFQLRIWAFPAREEPKRERHGYKKDNNLRVTRQERPRGGFKITLLGGICCGLAIGTASTFQQVGIQYTSVGKAGFITTLYIIMVPLLGLFLGKKVRPVIWSGAVMAAGGLYLLCVNETVSLNKGDIYVFICAIIFSVHILVIDYFSPKADGVKLSCIQFYVSAAISLVLALLFETPSLRGLTAAALPVLYAGIMSCGVAYTLQIIGQRGMEPAVASMILSLESVISVLAGWILLNQVLSTRERLGCVIVFVAVILVQLPQKKESLNQKLV